VEEIELTEHELRDFVATRVWKKIVTGLIDRSQTLTNENNQIDPMEDPTRIARNQGAIKELEALVDTPAIFLSEVKLREGGDDGR
jgi:hypothetical protein